MDFEEKTTAQTSGEAATSVDNAAEQTGNAEPGNQMTETSAEQETNDAEFTDGADGNGDHAQAPKQKAEEPEKKPVQSRERNAEEARKRREAEKAEAVSKARIDAIMRQIKKNGGDPLSDYSDFLKERKREEREAREAKAQRDAKVKNDLAEFREANPDVKVSELLADKRFSKFADGKYGRVPLTRIYSDYKEFIGEARQSEQQKAAQALANSRATPGAVSTAGNQDDVFYTREQVAKMSQSEVHNNWDRVKASMAKWK